MRTFIQRTFFAYATCLLETPTTRFSEALTVRARALLGKAATTGGANGQSSAAHWTEYAAKQRLHEVMGRMAGGDGQLLPKLLFHDLE